MFYTHSQSFVEFLEAHPPEGLNAKYEDLWRLCNDHPHIQAMLDETVKGKQGQRNDLGSNLVYNVHDVDRPAGNSRAAGLRKLRKYAEEHPDATNLYDQALHSSPSYLVSSFLLVPWHVIQQQFGGHQTRHMQSKSLVIFKVSVKRETKSVA